MVILMMLGLVWAWLLVQNTSKHIKQVNCSKRLLCNRRERSKLVVGGDPKPACSEICGGKFWSRSGLCSGLEIDLNCFACITLKVPKSLLNKIST